jgi:HlyD family secretion protein
VSALALVVLGLGAGAYRASLRRDPLEGLPTVVVHRAPVHARVVEDGEIESAEKTIVECELEAVRFRNAGRELQASDSSMIIELIPQGTEVKKGDVLCRLASSDYEELVRLQQIEYEEDVAQYRAAQLELERLELEMLEYRDGTRPQTEEQLLAAITLGLANVRRQEDRLGWVEQMVRIGYMPASRLASERVNMVQYRLELTQARLAHASFVQYKAPAAIAQIQGQIDRARSELSFQKSRALRDEQDLARYREQVERCTIRAPHDGVVIYARQDDDDVPIDLGTIVRKDQDLFYLPNLEKMEVHARLHETVLDRVRPGMPALAQVGALPGVVLEGEVVSVAPLPMQVRSRYQTDVKNYIGRIRLHSSPRGLMPGMTAQVEILTVSRPDALVIPPAALVVEAGRRLCYIVEGSILRRREVEIGACLPDRLEVIAGLSEGERVVAIPAQVDAGLVAPLPGLPAADEDPGGAALAPAPRPALRAPHPRAGTAPRDDGRALGSREPVPGRRPDRPAAQSTRARAASFLAASRATARMG